LSSASFHFLPLRFKYSPQHPLLKYPQPKFSLSVRDQISHRHETPYKITVLDISMFTFLYGRCSDPAEGSKFAALCNKWLLPPRFICKPQNNT